MPETTYPAGVSTPDFNHNSHNHNAQQGQMLPYIEHSHLNQHVPNGPSQRPPPNNYPNDQNNNSSHHEEGGGEGRADRRDLFEEIRNGGGHWSQLLRQVVLRPPEGSEDKDELIVPLNIEGGSENGKFAGVGQVTPELGSWIAVGYLQPGDIILDIQGQQVREQR